MDNTKMQKIDLWRYAKQFAVEDFQILTRPQSIMENPDVFKAQLLSLSKKDLVKIVMQVNKQRKINNIYIGSVESMINSLNMNNQYSRNMIENYKFFTDFVNEYMAITTDYKFEIKVSIQQVLLYFKEKKYPVNILKEIATKTEKSLNDQLMLIEQTGTISDVLAFLSKDILYEMRDQLKIMIIAPEVV